MSKYLVSWDEVCSYTVEIEADSYDKALTAYSYGDYTNEPESVWVQTDMDSIRCEEV